MPLITTWKESNSTALAVLSIAMAEQEAILVEASSVSLKRPTSRMISLAALIQLLTLATLRVHLQHRIISCPQQSDRNLNIHWLEVKCNLQKCRPYLKRKRLSVRWKRRSSRSSNSELRRKKLFRKDKRRSKSRRKLRKRKRKLKLLNEN